MKREIRERENKKDSCKQSIVYVRGKDTEKG